MVGDEEAERGTFVPVAARFATVGGDDDLLRIIERDAFLSTAICLGVCGGGDSLLLPTGTWAPIASSSSRVGAMRDSKEYAIPLKMMTDNNCQKRASVGATSEAVLCAAKVAIRCNATTLLSASLPTIRLPGG